MENSIVLKRSARTIDYGSGNTHNRIVIFNIRYDTLLMHKAIMAHEHINKYKYNTVQYRI